MFIILGVPLRIGMDAGLAVDGSLKRSLAHAGGATRRQLATDYLSRSTIFATLPTW
jgi:hypothetical protein